MDHYSGNRLAAMGWAKASRFGEITRAVNESVPQGNQVDR